jgi:hypothetical protein
VKGTEGVCGNEGAVMIVSKGCQPKGCAQICKTVERNSFPEGMPEFW